MQNQKPKIPLYKVRSFGEKLTATFDFLKENWRLWLQCAVYLLLPLSLLQALAFNFFMGGMFNSALMVADGIPNSDDGLIKMGLSYIPYSVFTVIGMVLLSAFTYAMMSYYRKSDHRLNGVSVRDLRPMIVRNAKKGIVLGLLECFLGVVAVAIWFLLVVQLNAPILILLLVLVAFALIVPLLLAMPVYLFEDNQTVFGAIWRAMRLGFHSWGWAFLLFFTLGLLGSILQSVTTIPWYISMIIKLMFFIEDNGGSFISSAPYSFIMYLLSIIQIFGMYLSQSFSVVGAAYQYSSVAEELDGISVDEDIQNFERLSDADLFKDFDRI
ncbi:MAG: hypothetical protein IJV27_13005 [Prevotella sp.]|nr:hypothetical protein [Prevotella sp.]